MFNKLLPFSLEGPLCHSLRIFESYGNIFHFSPSFICSTLLKGLVHKGMQNFFTASPNRRISEISGCGGGGGHGGGFRKRSSDRDPEIETNRVSGTNGGEHNSDGTGSGSGGADNHSGSKDGGAVEGCGGEGCGGHHHHHDHFGHFMLPGFGPPFGFQRGAPLLSASAESMKTDSREPDRLRLPSHLDSRGPNRHRHHVHHRMVRIA